MTKLSSRLSRRSFLKATSALALVTGLSARAQDVESGAVTLDNGLLQATFDGRGLTAIYDVALGRTVPLQDDGFSYVLDVGTVESTSLPVPRRSLSRTAITYQYASGTQTVTVVYELQPGWRFLSKQVSLDFPASPQYHVQSVTPFRATLGTAITAELTNRGGAYGVFLRLASDRSPGHGLFLTVQNPFMQWHRTGHQMAISYNPDMDWKTAYGPYVMDRVCLGPYTLSGHGFPNALVPEWEYRSPHDLSQAGSPMRDSAESQALTDCVRAFLLAPPKRSARVHVGWCENDYQIDVASPHGEVQYQRIIAQASALGLHDILYSPENSRLAARDQSTDAWSWEYVTWLGLGVQIRTGTWEPGSSPIPSTVSRLRDDAEKSGLGLLAYIYPSLNWKAVWNGKSGMGAGADSANREFQDWLVQMLTDFHDATGIRGYSFDYWWLNDTGSSPYAQWSGCRWILETLRRRLPDIVIDGRQSYQEYGPWTWLAGNYPHPTTGDEQPESFRAFPDLHFDRVCGNRQRWAAWWYRMENFCPTEILPGFITHQTQRSDASGKLVTSGDFRVRDWDYLGWKYSLLSSIATAPMNHVVNMIPARDPDEFAHFSDADRQFLRGWLDWTDTHHEILRHVRPIIGQPRIGFVDGTAAVADDHGFVFLFNPNARAMTAVFTLDTSIGLTRGDTFTLHCLYPRLNVPLAIGRYGETLSLPMEGASALALEIIPGPPAPPTLLNAPGTVTYQGGTLTMTNVSGPIGHTRDLQVFVEDAVKAVTVNGTPMPFSQSEQTVSLRVSFAGERFDQCHSVGGYDPEFTGGKWDGTFTIPTRIFDQLRRRRLQWPIPYTEDDLMATWLGSDRLLLYIQIAEPGDDMAVELTLNGQPAPLQKAYTSIYPQAVDRTFVGWYLDVTELTPDVAHGLSLSLPPLKPGQFQGVFFENVETEYTDALSPAAPGDVTQ